MNPRFWSGQRVLVTGHSGFKGTWLTLWLRRMGAEVVGYSLPDDIRDAGKLHQFITIQHPSIVFHLAAQALVRPSYAAPVDTYATNVMGTVHLLEAVRATSSVRATVIVTSDKCYENQELSRGYRESDPLGGYDPYSSSKACAEMVAAAYRRSYGMMLATARAGNVIGGGDWSPDRLVPDCIRAFQSGEPVLVRHPESVRPWQHVLEPLAGYLILAEKLYEREPDISPAYNFGPSETGARTVAELVGELAKLWGGGAAWQADTHAGPQETAHLQVSSALARRELGWQPRLTLSAALAWTVEWYRSADPAAVSRQQIARYEALFPSA